MVVAGLVIETAPQCSASVAQRWNGYEGLQIKGNDGTRRVAAVWRGADGAKLESLSETLVATDEDILGIFPTFVGQDGA